MLKKVQSLFPSAITTNILPTIDHNNHYWFKEESDEPFWLGVPKSDVNKDQLEILSVLYERVTLKASDPFIGSAKEWYEFLFHENKLPSNIDTEIRFIHFQIQKVDQGMKEVEEAIKAFFFSCLAFIWLDETNGIVIEEKTKVVYAESDFHSISTTLENDFYMKVFFYIGKFTSGPAELRELFLLEREHFIEARKQRTNERILSFEKIFPMILATNIPENPRTLLDKNVIRVLSEDAELRETMKVFLEHNSNMSLAAKKLYVHRNTLQYRLNRFSEKTGIDLKDFSSAMTVYIACLLASDIQTA